MRPLGDELLVQRAARGLAVQAAGLVAAAMLLLVALVSLVVVRGQQRATDTLLRTTAASADDVGDPPAGAWIVIAGDRGTSASPGLPEEVEGPLASLRTPPPETADFRDVTTDDESSYRVLTRRRGDATVQVVLDLRPQHEERERILKAMGAAAALSLAVAAGLGVLLGRRAVRPLAEALLLQRTFVADASHELRTPLTLLSTRVQVLDRELQAGSADPQVLEDSRGVVADVQRMGEVVEDLLVAADPRREEPHEPLDLGALVAGVVESARAHAAQAGVTLTSNGHDGEPLVVRGAAPALRRGLLALVDNAVDHTPAGGVVDLRLRRARGSVVVAVSDTGPGLAPDAAAGVLRRFHSGGQRAGRAHYGLGLALTRDVANRHGGELRLVPTARGTTFELVLPEGR
jgi:signal transduction histidine kinase